MSWPGKPGDKTPPLTPLTPEQEKRFAAGHESFTQICAECHQPSGLGQEGVAPPLVDSEWVLGPPERLARIALNGLHGPLKVGKKTIDMEMPGLKALPDEQIASILTYVRREWGHEAGPVDPKLVDEGPQGDGRAAGTCSGRRRNCCKSSRWPAYPRCLKGSPRRSDEGAGGTL